MVYERVWFNTGLILKNHKDAKAFSENKLYHVHWPKLSLEKRKERLKELFKLCKLIGK